MVSWCIPFVGLFSPALRPAFIRSVLARNSLKADLALIGSVLRHYMGDNLPPAETAALLRAFCLFVEHVPGARALARATSSVRSDAFFAAHALESGPYACDREGDHVRAVQDLVLQMLRVFTDAGTPAAPPTSNSTAFTLAGYRCY